jgi:hypothetical protein
VFGLYWILEVITTVGYGDYTGGTKVEYLISIILEIFGVMCFSLLMSIVTEVMESEYNYQMFCEHK